MNSKYFLTTCVSRVYQSDVEIAWNDGGNSTAEEYDPSRPAQHEVTELTNDISWTTRRGHAKEPPERDTKLQKMRRS
jgi:hypothetical protein